MKHTEKDAKYCLWFFKKFISDESKLIGSFGKGKKTSNHDIDIYIPDFFPKGINKSMRFFKLCEKIKSLINAKSFEKTDWGGIYFENSIFGDVDVFFDISEFDK